MRKLIERLQRQTDLSDNVMEASGKEWIVRVNNRRVQWSRSVYKNLFGKKNTDRGVNYAIVKASSSEDAVKKFCDHKLPGKRLNPFYFEATPVAADATRPEPYSR